MFNLQIICHLNNDEAAEDIDDELLSVSTHFFRYREQAAQDADWVWRRVQELSQQLGPRKVMITEGDVKTFCKNSHGLRVLKGKAVADEYKGSINMGDIGMSVI